MSIHPLAQDVAADPDRSPLSSFGYTARETQFLQLVATHSGYFLRRQYAEFLGKSLGGTVAALIDKAFARGHLKVSSSGRTQIYHLAARSVYAALGLGDNRNRRDRQPITIVNKLMCLDFVLRHRDRSFLGSELQKWNYFVDERAVSASQLPVQVYRAGQAARSTSRYFIEKYPIFIRGTAADDPTAVVGFCFIDEGLTTTSRLESFLGRYRALLVALGHTELVYVATTPRLFEVAARVVERWTTAGDSQSTLWESDGNPRLQAYFLIRSQFEAGEFQSFDRAKLIQFRELQQQFSGSETDALYAKWRSELPHVSNPKSASETRVRTPMRVQFSTCLLPSHPSLVGSLYAF